MTMKRSVHRGCGVAVAILLCGLSAGCTSSTQMLSVWSDPDFSGAPGGKVLVLGIGRNQTATMVFENAMAERLAAHNMQVTKGSTLHRASAPIDTAFVIKYVTDNGIDLVTVTRLIDRSTELEWVPGSTAYVPVAGYHNIWGYYATSYAVVHEPGYLRTSKSGTVETNVYSGKTGALVWSGLSKTVDPATLDDAIWEVSDALVKSMAARGVFGPTPEK